MNDPLFRFQTYLSREYELGFHEPSHLSPFLNIEDVWKDYTGQGVTIAVTGPVDHLHPDLSANYDQDYLSRYNAWTSGDLLQGSAADIVAPTFWIGLAAADGNNGEGIVGVAYEATIRGEVDVAAQAPADVMLSSVFGDPYEVGGGFDSFSSSARGGLGNIVLLNSPDVWQSTGDYTSGTLHTEFEMNTDRHNITVSGLTAYGYEPHGLGNTHGPMTLVAAPIFTSSYLPLPSGPIPETNEDLDWNGSFDPLASSDTTTTLGLDISGPDGSNDSQSLIGDGWEAIARVWFQEELNQVDSANYTYDASTNGAIGVAGGVVALMLEANPSLGWRDVQEILAYSANPLLARPMPLEPQNTGSFATQYFEDVQNGAKNWNGGGLWHSAETGFGALDAHAAVRLAETWTGSHNSDNEQMVSLQADNLPNGTFPMGDWTDLSDLSDIHKSAPTVLDFVVDMDTALEVEHVSLSVDLTATDYSLPIGTEPAARFIFSIISPDGTQSSLSSSARAFYWNGPDPFTEIDWEFTTRAFWGETTTAGDGEWIVRVEYEELTDDRVDVTIDDLTLNFYGKSADQDDTYIFTDAASLLAADWSKSNGAQQWVVRPNAPVLSDAVGHNVVNAAAMTHDLVLSTQTGARAFGYHDPQTEFDFDGATEFDLYEVGSGSILSELIAGNGDDLLLGSARGEVFVAGRGNDEVSAGSGNDILTGGTGNDYLNGGGGGDQARFEHNFGAYSISTDANGFTTFSNSATGTLERDVTVNVEYFKFADRTLSFSELANGGPDRAADLSGDGREDLVFFNAATRGVGMIDALTSDWSPLGAAGTGWQAVATGDVEDDGAADIIWFNTATKAVGRFDFETDGSFAWRGIGTAGGTWEIAGTGDFDGDGDEDILWQNEATNSAGFYRMDDGAASWRNLGNTGDDWSVVATGDLNGNGRDDIVWYNSASGALGQFQMNANGSKNWLSITTLGAGWGVAGAGDFDGDLDDDILVFQASSGRVGQFVMSGNAAAWAFIGQAGSGWHVEGAGDFNGDGLDDILWRNNATGQIGQFQMRSTGYDWDAITVAGSDWDIVL